MAKKAGGEDFASMDVIFDLSAEIDDPELCEMYEISIHNLRHEVRNLPLQTVQIMMAERIASLYIALRHKEQNTRNYVGSTYHKSLTTVWLNMVQELNKTLNINGDFQRTQILGDVRDIIVQTLSEVSDPELREYLVNKMAEKFQAAGL